LLWLKSKFDNSRGAEDPYPFKPIEELEKEAQEKFEAKK
jgi:hypothetical protein